MARSYTLTQDSGTAKKKNSKGKKAICWTSKQIYLSSALSAWGDRLWMFAVGLYLAILFEGSFQYTAIYGFTTCVSVIIGGPYIGTWVDKTSRLKAATCALVTQNLAVAICAGLLILLIEYSEEISETWNGGLQVIFLVAVVVFGVIGELASVASRIAIVKDWIVVLADNDEAKLSKMNSIMRTIDLTTSILAPAVVAQIIAFASRTAGAAFIAGWNLVSGGFEIYLLNQIFTAIPQLAHKNVDEIKIPEINVIDASSPEYGKVNNVGGRSDLPHTPIFPSGGGLCLPNQQQQELIPTPRGISLGLPASTFSEVSLTPLHKVDEIATTPCSGLNSPCDNESVRSLVKDVEKGSNVYRRWHLQVFKSLEGWEEYFHQRVRWAGVGLALLYMTVLGFDSITIAYMYSQGVSESMIGVISAVGALSGILGSLSFPLLRKKLGKCGVGNFGFGFESICLILCVVSVFTAGSPFQNNVQSDLVSTTETSDIFISSTEQQVDQSSELTSVTIFIVGVVVSRFGLWIADLSVTQFFQEDVIESQRGIINGVQDSMNQIMNLIKFILVIVLPNPSTFGFLIMSSWAFVFLGWIFFMGFTCSWRKRMQKIRNNNS